MFSFSKIVFTAALMFSIACDASQANSSGIQQPQSTVPFRVQNFSYEVINTYPHDSAAFTQGLVYHQGILYESTGLNSRSSLRQVELETGRVMKKVDVPSVHFAEGLALFNNRLYQLTWQTQTTFVYDLDSFNQLRTHSYSGEGWGLTHNGQSLIMSNGSNQIRFLDPETFQVQRTISVTDNERSVSNLNELEFIKGEIFANIWLTDRIARIDPNSGRVTGWINLAGLLPLQDRNGADVLNGIAYDEAGDRLFITGKLWPKLFQIKLVSRRDPVSR
ncbi:MAG: glutaminyl-peptide cyclotransferase [Acidobacteriota bacterium]|nr:glutaminyl-peptide cyclotransferase [Acidobacteriota bacterium]